MITNNNNKQRTAEEINYPFRAIRQKMYYNCITIFCSGLRQLQVGMRNQ